jgi:hypothetical protein
MDIAETRAVALTHLERLVEGKPETSSQQHRREPVDGTNEPSPQGTAAIDNRTAEVPGMLVIPSGDSAVTVLVIAMYPTNQPTVAVAGFGLSKFGPFYQGGIAWAYPIKSAGLAVTWSLGDGVSYLSSNSTSIQFSPVFNSEQLLSIPAKTDNYGFTVHFAKGHSEDPQIIVTPT